MKNEELMDFSKEVSNNKKNKKTSEAILLYVLLGLIILVTIIFAVYSFEEKSKIPMPINNIEKK